MAIRERNRDENDPWLIFDRNSLDDPLQCRPRVGTAVLIDVLVRDGDVTTSIIFTMGDEASGRYPSLSKSQGILYHQLLPESSFTPIEESTESLYAALLKGVKEAETHLEPRLEAAIRKLMTSEELNQSRIACKWAVSEMGDVPEGERDPIALSAVLEVRRNGRMIAEYFFEVPFNEAHKFFHDGRLKAV